MLQLSRIPDQTSHMCICWHSYRQGWQRLEYLAQRLHQSHIISVLQAGDVQLWGLDSKAQVDSLPCADPVTSIAYIHNTAFLCMGCESGGLQFAQLIAEHGAPADGVCAAQGLELLPYECKCDSHCKPSLHAFCTSCAYRDDIVTFASLGSLLALWLQLV